MLGAPAAGDDESAADRNQNDAHIGRQNLAGMGFHTDVDVAGIEAVALGVWHRDEERENAEHGNNEADDEESFHGSPNNHRPKQNPKASLTF